MASTVSAPPAPQPFNSPDRADLVIITSDGTSLYVVKAFLIYASQFFANLLRDGTPDETYDDRPVYRSSEDCRTMCAVLRLCYPVDTEPWEIIVNIPVLEALQKYMMEDAMERWKKTIVLLDLAKTQPLRIFAIACRCRWGDVARAAAKAILAIPLRDWQTSKELRNITGMDYHVLVRYYMQCCDAVEEAFSSPDGADIAVPLRSNNDAMTLKKISGRNNPLAVRYQESSNGFWPDRISVPTWVVKLVENARDRTRGCPGRPAMCDESLVVAALNAGETYNMKSSTVLEVCELVDAGVQAVINKVEIQLDFKDTRVKTIYDSFSSYDLHKIFYSE